MLTEHTKKENKVRRRLERLKVRLEKYPNQITREEKDFLAKAIAVNSYLKEKKGAK